MRCAEMTMQDRKSAPSSDPCRIERDRCRLAYLWTMPEVRAPERALLGGESRRLALSMDPHKLQPGIPMLDSINSRHSLTSHDS